jgi:hypothetical protein
MILHTAFDYDDASPPPATDVGVTFLREKDSYSKRNLPDPKTGSMWTRSLVPQCVSPAYSGTFASYANMPYGTWLDTAYPNVQYYAIKGVFDGWFTAATLFNVKAEITTRWEFNGVKSTGG